VSHSRTPANGMTGLTLPRRPKVNSAITFPAQGHPFPQISDSASAPARCLSSLPLSFQSCRPKLTLFTSNTASSQPQGRFRSIVAPDTTLNHATHAPALPHLSPRLEQRGPERRRRTNGHPRNCTFQPTKHGGRFERPANQLHYIYDYAFERDLTGSTYIMRTSGGDI
jgi:hypothetical protein